ncbi:MAG: transposase, partial [Mucilaginibacter sp.]|nr:transposase [Mucilaginibacter sp.]
MRYVFTKGSIEPFDIAVLQIVKAIKEYEGSGELTDVYRELGVHKSTFYNWRKKYAGMDSQELKRLKEL